MHITFTDAVNKPKLSDPAMLGEPRHDRRPLDHYPTPAWVTEAVIPYLLRHITVNGRVWECACGTGTMAAVLYQNFTNVIATDLEDYGYLLGASGIDFLACNLREWPGAIVTNPPYGDLAEQFIRHALAITKPVGVVAMLVRNEYDAAKERVDLFNQPPFACKIVLTSRPRWIPGSTGAPRHNYSWMIFDWRHEGPATIHYHVRDDKNHAEMALSPTV